MKPILLLFVSLIITLMLQAQVSKTLEVTAGNLKTALTADELNTVNNLTLNGTIDVRDIKTLRDEMPSLFELDMSGVRIVNYESNELVYSYYYYYGGGYGGGKSISDHVYRSTKNEIPNGAFANNTQLTTIILPTSLDSIGEYAFFRCEQLQSITLFSGVHSIGNCAFQDCKGLTSITIPSSVTSIGSCAFSGCDNLISINIPSKVASIEWNSFSGCRSLVSINIPESVTSIGVGAFSNCNSLVSIHIPKTVTLIGGNAFSRCYNLTSVNIPSLVTLIGDNTFDYCTSLRAIEIPSSVTSIGNSAFAECNGLTSFEIPSSVTSIGDYAFSKCTGLTNIEIPTSVALIGKGTFSGCSGLTTVTIPSSVNSISDYAFAKCTGLTSIKINSYYPVNLASSLEVFSGVDKFRCTVYIPKGSKVLYNDAEQWEDFWYFEEVTFIEVFKTQLNLAAKKGSNASTKIVANVDWKASTDQIWLSFSQSSGLLDETLFIIADANPNTYTRTATVIISAKGFESQTITITQEGVPTALLELTENTSQFKGYPNPFTDEIAIEIQNPKRTEISVDIYNLTGERIKTLATKRKYEKLELKWNGTNDSGQKVAPGVYICKVNNQAKKLIYQEK